MNTTSFHSLPVEILLLIADQLTIGDCYHCSYVSRRWYRIFRPRLYRSVDIHDSKTLNCFIEMVSKEQKLQGTAAAISPMFLPVSRCVKAIEISNVEIPKELQEFPVQSFSWRYVDPLMPMINQTMAYYGGLTSLTLKFTKSETTAQSSFDIYALLRQTLRLESLVLSGLFKELTTSDLEALQKEAPKTLTRLDLEGDALATDNHWLQSNPSTSIQDLRLAYRWPNARNSAMWLMYLTHKYPHVRQLKLEGQKGAATVVSTSSRLSGHGGEEQDLMEVDPLCVQACNIFSRFHPDLEHVRLVNLGLHPSLYHTMLDGLTNCRDIDLAGVEAPLSYSSEEKQRWLEDLFASFQERVERLNIKLVYPRIVMLGLSRCKNLRELTLSRTSGFITSRDHHWQLSLSNLLKSCPHLDQLTLRQLTVASPPSESTNDNKYALHPLRILRFEHVALPAIALQKLGTQCHQLRQLYIHHCKWLSENHQLNHVDLQMSEQTLDLVEIVKSGDVYTLQPHNLLSIQTTAIHYWYLSASSSTASTTKHDLSQANTWSQVRSMVNMQKLEYLDEYNELILKRHMEELSIARAQRTSTPSNGPCPNIKNALSHGYLVFQCKSVDTFYFNGTKVCL